LFKIIKQHTAPYSSRKLVHHSTEGHWSIKTLPTNLQFPSEICAGPEGEQADPGSFGIIDAKQK